jgi:hypothetical protein
MQSKAIPKNKLKTKGTETAQNNMHVYLKNKKWRRESYKMQQIASTV